MLLHTAHRPWPLPSRAYVMHQSWLDLLFVHWPIPCDTLRALIPAKFTLDTWDGTGWLGIVPFHMKNIRLRGLPPIPFTSAFPELNVRTYVTYQGKPGVYFFSLDARHRLAVEMARRLFHLSYLYAHIEVEHDPDGGIVYNSRRCDPRGKEALFAASYRPVSEVRNSLPGSHEHWLTERYCLYSTDKAGDVYRCDIHHVKWPLQTAEASITINSMAASHGIVLPDTPPLLHFARKLDVLIWGLERT
ncbi:YqjF family protein [Paenibacillus thalictri]|uniref:YqjF family protein n=1 Tax=Paenibacillus thalictri TaxID=2527873 RepID=UPI003B8338F6